MPAIDNVSVQRLTIESGRPAAIASTHHPLAYSCTTGMISLATEHGIWLVTNHQLICLPVEIPHLISTYGTTEVEQLSLPMASDVTEPYRPILYQMNELIRPLLNQAKLFSPENSLTARDHLLLALLLAEITSLPANTLSLPLPTAHGVLRQLCESFIRQPNIHQPMEEWIERLQVSRRTFARHFERHTGKHFSEWIQLACLAHALPRIASGESIKTVSQSIGFEHVATFGIMCKRLTGLAPTAYQPQPKNLAT